MKKYKCRFCKEEFEFEKVQQFAAHSSNCLCNPNKKEKFEKLSKKLKEKDYSHLIKRKIYLLNCLKCKKEFSVEVTEEAYGKGKYTKHCSRECSNSHTRTEKSKLKTSNSSKISEKAILAREKREDYYTSIGRSKKHTKLICKICGKEFNYKPSTKTCSKECKSRLLSLLSSVRLSKQENRVNYGRGKKSYLETSFEQWLKEKQVLNYETEKKFYNSVLNKNYFVDFLFEDKKIIIELDGTQHFKTVDKDKIRDQYLETLGYTVVRVSYKEYKNKSKESLILSLLIK